MTYHDEEGDTARAVLTGRLCPVVNHASREVTTGQSSGRELQLPIDLLRIDPVRIRSDNVPSFVSRSGADRTTPPAPFPCTLSAFALAQPSDDNDQTTGLVIGSLTPSSKPHDPPKHFCSRGARAVLHEAILGTHVALVSWQMPICLAPRWRRRKLHVSRSASWGSWS